MDSETVLGASEWPVLGIEPGLVSVTRVRPSPVRGRPPWIDESVIRASEWTVSGLGPDLIGVTGARESATSSRPPWIEWQWSHYHGLRRFDVDRWPPPHAGRVIRVRDDAFRGLTEPGDHQLPDPARLIVTAAPGGLSPRLPREWLRAAERVGHRALLLFLPPGTLPRHSTGSIDLMRSALFRTAVEQEYVFGVIASVADEPEV